MPRARPHHTDGGFLTLLQQDAVGGLEAEVYGTWVGVPALPGPFVVNIGERPSGERK